MATPTPGPWVVEGPRFGYFTVRQDPANWDGHGYQAICGLPSLTRRSAWRPTFEANARLIAAAPLMYQELALAADTFRDFSTVLRAIGKDVMSAAADVAERHIREQLATIAKADGR